MPATRTERERGTALVFAALVGILVLGLASVLVTATTGMSQGVLEDRGALHAQALAEAGIALKTRELAAGEEGELRLRTATGEILAICEPVTGGWRVTGTGTSPGATGPVTRVIETWVAVQWHPLFGKATFVANSDGVANYTLTLGPGDGSPRVTGGATWDESVWAYKTTTVSEVDLRVDFNKDGDLTDAFTLSDIYGNRVAWGWDPSGSAVYISRSSDRNYYRLDIDKSGSLTSNKFQVYKAPTVSVPTLRDPRQDAALPVRRADWDTFAQTTDADYVDWDFYVNGDVRLTGHTNVWGDVEATGRVFGLPVEGQPIEGAPIIAPPDLSAMDYELRADLVVRAGSVPSWMRSQQTSSTYGDQLGATSAHDRPYFHLGASGGAVNVSATRGLLVVVKGNLWLHDLNSFTIDLPSSRKSLLTIVVEGNLYVSDDLQYRHADSAVLFIVKSSDLNRESFLDANRNYRYDPGEMLIDDDGDGVYEGPKEGQGNVYFGDPRFGTGGVTDGFIYAQNNVHVINPPMSVNPPSGAEAIWGVRGFISAGGIVDLGTNGVRQEGANYQNLRIKYDARFDRGLVLPGMPRASVSGGGPGAGLTVVSWIQRR